MHARCCMRPPQPSLCITHALNESCTEPCITQSATVIRMLHVVHRPRDVQLEAKRLFKLIDLDGNGRIALEELAGVLGFRVLPPPVPVLGTKHGASSLPPDGAEHSASYSNSQVPPEAHANAIDQAHGMLRQNPMLMVRRSRAWRWHATARPRATVLKGTHFNPIPTRACAHSGRHVPYDEPPSAQVPKIQRTRGVASRTWSKSST